MIQRIQSLYLLLTAILVAVAAFMPMGRFVMADGWTSAFRPLGLDMPSGAFQSTWGLFGILLLSAIIALGTIFLYINRTLQIRLTVLSTLLLVGYYIVFAVFAFMLKGGIEGASFRIGWALCLPAVGIILNYLAFRGIYADEVLIKSLNRLR